jgi:hypothetical protein
MQNLINTSPLSIIIQQIRAAELSQQKEVRIPIQQARLLNLALAEIMEKLVQDYEQLFTLLKTSTNTEVISVTMDGGSLDETK